LQPPHFRGPGPLKTPLYPENPVMHPKPSDIELQIIKAFYFLETLSSVIFMK
jgi:hypothetical protein